MFCDGDGRPPYRLLCCMSKMLLEAKGERNDVHSSLCKVACDEPLGVDVIENASLDDIERATIVIAAFVILMIDTVK